MPDHDEPRLVSAIRRQLDADAEHLDGRTRLRLERARRKALSPPARCPMAGWRRMAVTAVLALLMLGVWQRPDESLPDARTATTQAGKIAATPESSLEKQGELLTEDGEFYAWLGELSAGEQTAQ